jgi:hypothetical protein
MKLVREFKCGLTGTECVIVLNHFDEEICYEKHEYLEMVSYINHEETQLRKEQGT